MSKTVIFAIILPMFLSFGTVSQATTSSKNAIELDRQAHALFDQGKYATAINLWQKALPLFKKQKDSEMTVRAMVQIAKSQKADGEIVLACLTLQEILNANSYLCLPSRGIEAKNKARVEASENHIIAAILFARIIRDMGLFNEAQLYLNEAQNAAQKINHSELSDSAKIGLGTLQIVELKYDRDRAIYSNNLYLDRNKLDTIKDKFEQAFQHFESVTSPSLLLESQLKWIHAYQQLQIHSQTYATRWNISINRQSQYQSILEDILSSEISNFSAKEQLRLRYEKARLIYQDFLQSKLPESRDLVRRETIALIQSAKDTNHKVYLAFGYGLLGQLYLSSGQLDQAIGAFHLASQNGTPSNPRYQWQHEIAKLFEQQGNQRQAERFYDSAIAQIEQIEWNLSPADSAIKTNFQEQVRSVFNDAIRFQFEKNEPNFEKILRMRDQFSLKTIENYLGCGSLNSIEAEQIIEKDPNAVLISIFRGNDTYHTILKKNNSFYHSKTDAKEIDLIAKRLTFIFSGDSAKSTERFLKTQYSVLYDKLLKPVRAYIDENQTILFNNLEPQLQQIPMALLYDGESYLIEHHPIALVGNAIYEPRKLSPHEQKVTFAGIKSNPVNFQNFSALPFVEMEYQSIAPNRALINEDFTKADFLDQIREIVPIIHIASHGQFSSNPEQTFLLAWDEKIFLSTLTDAVADRAQNSSAPIELLVLSACETAKGDRYATLGIAGFAIQSDPWPRYM